MQYEGGCVSRVREAPNLLVKTQPRILGDTPQTSEDFLLKLFWLSTAAMERGAKLRACSAPGTVNRTHRKKTTRQLKVRTLEGGVLTLEVMPATTFKKLKVMLHEKKHCKDLIERQILQVKVLVDGLLVDDDQRLESAELLHTNSEVTVVYCRNEVEAATKETIRAEGFFQVNITPSLAEIPAQAFKKCRQMVKVAIPSL